MHCYYIRTANNQHFIVEGDTAQKAMERISNERKLQCPWTNKTILHEPALKVQYCERLSRTKTETETESKNATKPPTTKTK
jgi:hypothetical protein